MSEQSREITISLTISELRAVQNILRAASALVSLGKAEVMQNQELTALEEKINNLIGDGVYLAKRAEAERGIREYFDDPAELQVALQHLERDWPLPVGLQQ
jgi:hypothetical protein